jgi:hypothetical protein
MLRIIGFLLVGGIVVVASTPPAQSVADTFHFHSNAWINLHHFVRAVARGLAAQAPLSDEERTTWNAGAAFFKGHLTRSLLFDQEMIEVNDALGAADGKATLQGSPIPRDLAESLERLMPVYRRHWWPAHDRSNRDWIAAVTPLLVRHGAALRQAVARAYDITWPTETMSVDVSMFAGPSGAYTTGPPTRITITSEGPDYAGPAALEMLFHEASHAFGKVLSTEIERAAAEQKASVPRQLWHAVLFHTAGELTRRELAAHGVADYVEFAEKHGLYRNLCGDGCRARIVERWTPHLDGKRSIAEALSALVGDFK